MLPVILGGVLVGALCAMGGRSGSRARPDAARVAAELRERRMAMAIDEAARMLEAVFARWDSDACVSVFSDGLTYTGVNTAFVGSRIARYLQQQMYLANREQQALAGLRADLACLARDA